MVSSVLMAALLSLPVPQTSIRFPPRTGSKGINIASAGKTNKYMHIPAAPSAATCSSQRPPNRHSIHVSPSGPSPNRCRGCPIAKRPKAASDGSACTPCHVACAMRRFDMPVNQIVASWLKCTAQGTRHFLSQSSSCRWPTLELEAGYVA